MTKRTPILLVTCGTTGARIAASVKATARRSPDMHNCLGVLAIDTAFDDTLVDQELTDTEKLSLADLPVAQIKSNPEAYPAFGQIRTDVMESIAALKAGALIPATVHCALLGKFGELEHRLMCRIQELGASGCEESVVVWVLGSISSTTGRGCMLETLIAVDRVAKRLGSDFAVNAVVMDSEGLAPPHVHIRRRIEGAFYRELERAFLSTRKRCIPRPHDQDWFGKPANQVFRFTGAYWDNGNVQSLDELANSTIDWLTISLLNPVVYNLLSGPAGDRARLLPAVQPTDCHPHDPRPRYLQCSGLAALSLNVPAIRLFAESERGLRSLRRIEGVKLANVQNLIRELRLEYTVLANTAGEGSFVSSLQRVITGLDLELSRSKSAGWAGLIHGALHTLGRQCEQAQAVATQKIEPVFEKLQEAITDRVAAFLIQSGETSGSEALTALGLNGSVALLVDCQKQVGAVKVKATEKLVSPVALGDLHRKVDEAISKLSRFDVFNRGARENMIGIVRADYSHALEVAVATAVLSGAQSFEKWLGGQLELTRKALANVQRSQELLMDRRSRALATHRNGRVRHLVEDAPEMEKLLDRAELMPTELIAAAGTAFLEKLSTTSTLLPGLAAITPEDLADGLVLQNAAYSPVEKDVHAQFAEQFAAKYPTEAAKHELFAWLVDRARPMSGFVDRGLQHRLKDPIVSYRTVLVPAAIEAVARKHLLQLGVSAGEIRAVSSGLDAIVCAEEKLGLPAHAFPFIRNVGGLVPDSPEERAQFTIARWGDDLPTIDNYEPYRGLSSEQMVHAGLLAGSIGVANGEVVLLPDNVFLGVNLQDAIECVSRNGQAAKLKSAIRSALIRTSLNDLTTRRQTAVRDGLIQPECAIVISEKLHTYQQWLKTYEASR